MDLTADSQTPLADIFPVALDNLPDGLIVTDSDSQILYANATIANWLTASSSQFCGKKMSSLGALMDEGSWLEFCAGRELSGEARNVNLRLHPGGPSITVEMTVRNLLCGWGPCLLFYCRPTADAHSADKMLRTISEGTSSVVGGDFFKSLAYHLVNTVGIRYAIITECANINKTRLRTLVYIERENFLDNFEYEVNGTPCELVMDGKPYFCESHLEDLFPREKGIQSYFAVPIYLHNGEVVGHLAIFDTHPMHVSQKQLSILQIFANRAGAEMERKLNDLKMQEGVIRYQTLFEDSPIGLCEEDYSEVKKHVDELKEIHGCDLATVFAHHPEEIWNSWQKVIRLKANKAQVKLFDLQTQQQYFDYLHASFMPSAFEALLLTFESGQLSFEKEIEIRTSTGIRKYINVKRVLLPGSEKDWHKSLLTCVDVSKQKSTQENLHQALREVKALKEKLEAENIYLQEEIKHEHNFNEIVCQSSALNKVLDKIQQVAVTDATVLILGESGTGKELIARAIHSTSNRANRPLVKVNCAALPATLIESELFGHEKGAFTGAFSSKQGRFELADKGTIFLDEIGELPVELQAKLLRVIQEGEFERLGSSKTVKVDVRVIAATNRNLEESIANKEFRADLFYRLNVFPIVSPPLRDRKDDIPILVNHFCKKYNAKIGRHVRVVPKRVQEKLMEYHWPGNVRELENVVERALILSTGDVLELGEWSPAPLPNVQSKHQRSPYPLTLEEMEREHIRQILHLSHWKIRGEDGAAKKLGLNPTTLEARIKKLGLTRDLQ